jgi:DNA-binding NarL/FixJ family response regulator
MKQESGDALVMAIRQVLKGGVYLSSRLREILINKAFSPLAGNGYADFSSLTDREMQVFTLLGEGKGSLEIGQQMNVSVKTVDAYRAHIKYKLRLRNGLELLRLAILHTQPNSTSVGFSRSTRAIISSLGPRTKTNKSEVS